MRTPLAPVSDHLYALLRIVAGFLFFFHGAQKLFGAFGGNAQPLASLPGLAGIIETVCGVLVALGLFGWVAAFIASGEMAVAYFLRHQPGGLWPIQNRGELAVLYCFVFFYIASRGSGRWSLDALRGRR